jgi:hypothetical protein
MLMLIIELGAMKYKLVFSMGFELLKSLVCFSSCQFGICNLFNVQSRVSGFNLLSS